MPTEPAVRKAGSAQQVANISATRAGTALVRIAKA
jgi:hypothetical protein